MRLSRFMILLALAVMIAGCATAGQEGVGRDEGATTVTEASGAVDDAVPATSSNSPATSLTDGEATEPDNGAQPGTSDSSSEAREEDDREDVDREDVDREEPPGETVPSSETGVPMTGEVPQDQLDAIMADASNESGVPVAELAVVRSEYVEWPDGSLGCPEPGVVYTQAVTPGYWVEIRAGDRTLDYRMNQSGFSVLCTGTVTPHGGGAGDGDSTVPPSGDS